MKNRSGLESVWFMSLDLQLDDLVNLVSDRRQNRILPVLFHRLWISDEKSKKWFPGSMAAGRSYLCYK
jgi:hypothetical protein